MHYLVGPPICTDVLVVYISHTLVSNNAVPLYR